MLNAPPRAPELPVKMQLATEEGLAPWKPRPPPALPVVFPLNVQFENVAGP